MLPQNVTDPILKIMCDMDGVLVDFAAAVRKIMPSFVENVTDANKKTDREMWRKISIYQKNGGRLWLEAPPMPDAYTLWDYIKPHGPEILTATGNPSFDAAAQKKEWVPIYLGPDIKINFTQKAIEKAQYATPTSILIDDKMKAVGPWREAGGIGILHINAETTINELKKLGL